MSDWPSHQHNDLSAIHTGTFGNLFGTGPASSEGDAFSGPAAYPIANRAIFVPFVLNSIITVVKMSIYNGAVVSGNFDIGIYDQEGNRLVSAGSTVQSGVNVIQTVDITDITLKPGLYYLAVNFDNITAQIVRNSLHTRKARTLGIKEMAVGALALPATATFAALTSTNFTPLIAAHRKVTV